MVLRFRGLGSDSPTWVQPTSLCATKRSKVTIELSNYLKLSRIIGNYRELSSYRVIELSGVIGSYRELSGIIASYRVIGNYRVIGSIGSYRVIELSRFRSAGASYDQQPGSVSLVEIKMNYTGFIWIISNYYETNQLRITRITMTSYDGSQLGITKN